MSKCLKLQICFVVLHIYGRRCLATNLELNPKIIGGTEAELKDIFFLVSICLRQGPYSCNHMCGGSLITQRAVISAAHCVYLSLPPNYFNLIMGILRKSQHTKYTLRFKVNTIIAHENHDDLTYANDIAIFFAKGRVPYNHFVHPIKLPEYEAEPSSICKVFGWGRTTTASISDIANKAEVELFSEVDCITAYSKPKFVITSGMICAGNKAGGTDSCQGDSGGPLIYDDALIGIVSFGVGCANPKYPGVYTDVFHYKLWINKTLRNLSECKAFSILYIILIIEILKFLM